MPFLSLQICAKNVHFAQCKALRKKSYLKQYSCLCPKQSSSAAGTATATMLGHIKNVIYGTKMSLDKNTAEDFSLTAVNLRVIANQET